jgi:hypothetical protein
MTLDHVQVEVTPPAQTAVDATTPRWGVFAVLAIAAVGLLDYRLVQLAGVGEVASNAIVFFHLYQAYERPFLLLTIACAIALVWWSGTRAGEDRHDRVRIETTQRDFGLLLALSMGVLLLTWLGSRLVIHRTPLSMDEFNSDFQARLFATGKIWADVPDRWRAFAPAITPTFVKYDSVAGAWSSSYWPVYAAIRSLFTRVGAEWVTNPLLAALTVPAAWGAARRMWPDSQARAWLAVLALVSSSQFLVTSMTSYAMPAHLLFNLVWLILYLRDDWIGVGLAPVVGGLALGLHNPFPHALFVAPFLIRLLWTRRWPRILWFGLIYLLFVAIWYRWYGTHAIAVAGGPSGFFAVPDAWMLVVQSMSLAEFVTWLCPVVAICFFIALRSWGRLGQVESDLAAGAVATFAFYFLFHSSQGHGWGYRYMYPVLGNVALLASVGGAIIIDRWPRKVVFRTVAVAGFVVAVQLPLRFWQVESFARPFAKGIELIRGETNSVVILDTRDLWYSRDLLRNDPFLAKPVVVRDLLLSPALRAELQGLYPGSVRVVGRRNLSPLGWPLTSPGVQP